MAAGIELVKYYQNPNIRARIIEYLGGQTLPEGTSVYVSGGRAQTPSQFAARPLHDLDLLLASGEEIARSLWDRNSLMAHLDVEYVNLDFPAEAFLDDHLPPGDGDVDWLSVRDRLQGSRFQGNLILELAGGESYDRADILRRARRGRRFLQHL